MSVHQGRPEGSSIRSKPTAGLPLGLRDSQRTDLTEA